MKRDYKVVKHNSTVCGYPGQDFDWSKFCWDGSQFYKDTCRHGHTEESKAPLPWVDNSLIPPNCEYLHVPYDWAEHSSIYRVRPNEIMYAGEVYRGRLVLSVKAIQKSDGWYWRVEL